MKNEKSGVYQIRCTLSGKCYVGSSCRIYTRWAEHRRLLRKNKNHCLGLQRAWNKYGEESFAFLILEECDREILEKREQHFIDLLKPHYNMVVRVRERIGPVPRAKIAAASKARAALITHCPRGHAYDEANTYRNSKGKRICRACNALRVSAIYAEETPEQREERRQRVNASHVAHRDERLAKQREYVLAHKEEKRRYDAARRSKLKVSN